MLAPSDTRAIENLIAEYAHLVDAGDFAAVGQLFANGVFIRRGGLRFSGATEVESMFDDLVVRYEDGSPRTHHVTTNVIIEPGERDGTATSRCYVTCFQATPGLPLQAIAGARYLDRFARGDSGRWQFAEREAVIRLTGDVSRHLRS